MRYVIKPSNMHMADIAHKIIDAKAAAETDSTITAETNPIAAAKNYFINRKKAMEYYGLGFKDGQFIVTDDIVGAMNFAIAVECNDTIDDESKLRITHEFIEKFANEIKNEVSSSGGKPTEAVVARPKRKIYPHTTAKSNKVARREPHPDHKCTEYCFISTNKRGHRSHANFRPEKVLEYRSGEEIKLIRGLYKNEHACKCDLRSDFHLSDGQLAVILSYMA